MQQTPRVKDDPKVVAQKAGLRYITDIEPGYSRKKSGEKFIYFDIKGDRIKDPSIVNRINSLAIPPAYSEVWICPYKNGHIQAIGMDERGRKQYRYHVSWQDARQTTKFDRMKAFGESLPKIRRQVGADLNLPGIPREKVLATLVDLLEKTLIRVGNEEYAKQNKSYGLTTMQNKHVDVDQHEITFAFKGKSNQYHEITLRDKQLAKIVKALQDLPGQELFQYIDDNDNLHCIHSEDINDYLQDITGQDFTAKDFRTWKGTVFASIALQKCPPCTSDAQIKRNVNQALKRVAAELGNTPAVCRKAYVHPGLIETYCEARNMNSFNRFPAKQLAKYRQLRKQEAAIMIFLERY